MDQGRAARQGALVAAIMLLAAGSWVPAANGDPGGRPHDGSHGKGAQGAQGHEAEPAEPAEPAEQPKAPDNDDNDHGAPAKQHEAGHHKTASHKAGRPAHATAPEHTAPAKSHPTPNANPGKTTICHHTGSAKNPWVTITVADRALPAHRRHGDLIPAPAGGCPKPAAAPSAQKDEPAAAPPAQSKEKAEHGKTTICHRTGSESNPWVEITIADPALKAHRAHGDLIPAPAEGCPKPQPAATPAPEAPVVGLGMGAQAPLPVTTVGAESQSTPAAAPSTAPMAGGGPVTIVTLPSSTAPIASRTASAAPRGQVLAETASSAPTAARAASAPTTDTGSRLPFTGLAVWLLALGGAGALLAGVALRRAHGMRR